MLFRSSKKSVTAADTVLGVIKRSKKGVGIVTIMGKTEYERKKVANIIYKLRRQGKIKSVGRGVYAKA